MDVKFKINNDTLTATDAVLKMVDTMPFNGSTNHMVYKSIGVELSDKFDKKTKKVLRSTDLLNVNQKTSFTLKFYQAWALHAILINLMPMVTNPHQKNSIQSLINELNQKTC